MNIEPMKADDNTTISGGLVNCRGDYTHVKTVSLRKVVRLNEDKVGLSGVLTFSEDLDNLDLACRGVFDIVIQVENEEFLSEMKLFGIQVQGIEGNKIERDREYDYIFQSAMPWRIIKRFDQGVS